MDSKYSGAIATAILIFAGCSHVAQSGFISGYNQLQRGKHLEKVLASQDFVKGKGIAIEIRKPISQGVQNNEEFPLKEAQNYLFEVLQRNLATEPGIHIISTGTEKSSLGERYLVLETAITRLDPGSRAMRWFASELGAGHSKVQVEGKLVDPHSGKLLIQFADSRAGSAMGGLDITGGSGREMLQADLNGIAKALGETLAELPTA